MVLKRSVVQRSDNGCDYSALFETCLGTEPIPTGSNRFDLVFFYFPHQQEKHDPPIFTLLTDRNLAYECSCMQRDKRSRACKLYNTSLHYIENFSTYVVSSRLLYTAYTATSLHNNRKVTRSRSTIHKHRRTAARVACAAYANFMSLFGIDLRVVHALRA